MMMSGCRISQQLGEYNPRQFGICSPLVPARKFTFFSNNSAISKTFLRFRYLGTNAASCSSSSSSSSVASNNDDLVGVSCINNDVCTQDKDVSRAPVFSGCLSRPENGCNPPPEGVSVTGGIVALGKFDALHIGHRELVIQAAKIGVPYLLSFVGMAEILGWEPRAPIVAKCDRKRILSSWAPLCGNVAPKEFQVEFSNVRYLTPQQFVEKLSKELQVRGVVAGQNYRFGYRAAGDASDLIRLCKEYGMEASIIDSVMDKNQESSETFSDNSHEQGQVSSTRVRKALANGDMKYVTELLGRPHRLVLKVEDSDKVFRERKRLSAPRSCLLNLPPREGVYDKCSLVIGDENAVPCRVVIDSTDIHLELDGDIAPITHNFESLGIQFDDSKA